MLEFTIVIQKISNKFFFDGTIIPCFRFVKPVIVKDSIIEMVPLCRKIFESFKENDHLKILMNEDNSVHDIENITRTEANDIEYCPVCGSKLLPAEIGVGRCINRNCMGQMSNTIFNFVSKLNFECTTSNLKILKYMLSRGMIGSILDLFIISERKGHDEEFITSSELSEFNFSMFNALFTASISKLLSALNIDGWSDYEYEAIEEYFNNNNLSSTYLDSIFVDSIRSAIEIDWEVFDRFMEIGNNKELFLGICYLLQK